MIAEFFTKNFFPGYKITNIFLTESKKEICISLEPLDSPSCPHCHSNDVVVHEYRKKQVRDDKMLGYFVVLEITYRVIRCNHCQKKFLTENIPFVTEGFRVTRRAENTVIEELEQAGSISDTANRIGLGWDTCKSIHKRYLQRTIYFSLGDASILAIDEFSIQKGHKYATVVVDLETKRVIWVGKGKSISEVNKFFKLCGTEGCKQIKAVAMDQNAGFASCVNKFCPNAKVVYDLFHMVYNFGRLVISAIRIRLANAHLDNGNEDGYSLLKRSRFLLLTRNANLTDERKIKLDNILSFFHDLYAANELKELLPEVFKASSKQESETLWDEWVNLAMKSNVEEIMKFAHSQNKNYRDGITNSGIYPIRTSVLEGINNKIKVLKRLAYGFRDLDYFFLRIRSAFKGTMRYA
ncbi:MAG: ISL3 family transposase [Succinivibrio sp.]|nr:ISL3 family transposase [Succinivibrio sp.]